MSRVSFSPAQPPAVTGAGPLSTFNEAVDRWFVNPANQNRIIAFQNQHLEFNIEKVRRKFQKIGAKAVANFGFASPQDRTTAHPGKSNISSENRMNANELDGWLGVEMNDANNWCTADQKTLSSYQKVNFKLAQSEADAELLNEEIDELRDEKQELEDQLEDSKSDVQDLQIRNRALRNKIQSLKRRHQKFRELVEGDMNSMDAAFHDNVSALCQYIAGIQVGGQSIAEWTGIPGYDDLDMFRAYAHKVAPPNALTAFLSPPRSLPRSVPKAVAPVAPDGSSSSSSVLPAPTFTPIRPVAAAKVKDENEEGSE